MAVPFADSPEFQRLLAGDDHVDLARVALEIGRDAYPEIDIEVYLEKNSSPRGSRAPFQAGLDRSRYPGADQLGALRRRRISREQGRLLRPAEQLSQRGTRSRPRHSDQPLLVYWTMAERLGLAMAGVDLPLHFMLRVDDGDQTCFVDPFHGGAVYDRERLRTKTQRDRRASGELVRCSGRALFKPGPDFADAQKPQSDLRTIGGHCVSLTHPAPFDGVQPPRTGELRDLGVLCVQADRLGEAIEPLKHISSLSPEARMQARSVSCSVSDSPGGFTLELTVHGCSRFRGLDVDDDPNEIFGTIQESSRDRPIMVDTALAGTRARRR